MTARRRGPATATAGAWTETCFYLLSKPCVQAEKAASRTIWKFVSAPRYESSSVSCSDAVQCAFMIDTDCGEGGDGNGDPRFFPVFGRLIRKHQMAGALLHQHHIPNIKDDGVPAGYLFTSHTASGQTSTSLRSDMLQASSRSNRGMTIGSFLQRV